MSVANTRAEAFPPVSLAREQPARGGLAFWLEVSRPGLWFPTLWLYLLPLSRSATLDSANFWVGLVFMSFPLNFLIYGWNDLVDAETDAQNPRKGTFMFGARPTAEQREQLPRALVVVTLLSFAPVAWLGGPLRMLAVLGGIALVCALYNHPTHGFRGRPPLELACQFAYLLVIPIAAWLNDAPMPPWPTLIYVALFCVQSQLIGEVMDIEPDRATGRKTTATVLGHRGTKLLILVIVALEVALLFFLFGDPWFAGALMGFLVWLILDLTVIYRGRAYTLNEMKLFGLASNAVALVTMGYVWWSACLMRLDGPLARLL